MENAHSISERRGNGPRDGRHLLCLISVTSILPVIWPFLCSSRDGSR